MEGGGEDGVRRASGTSRLRRWSVTLGSGYTPTFLTARSKRLEKTTYLFHSLN